MHDVLFRGGTVVTATGATVQDVYVRDGHVSALTEPGTRLPARSTVDLTGRHVLPGVIDGHSHFRTWSRHCDTLADLARSAAHGGVTTMVPFVMGMNAAGTDLMSRVTDCIDEGQASSPIDFGFHAAIADEPDTIRQIGELIDMGVTTFKMFMINRARRMMVDDGFLFRAMTEIGAGGGIAMVHAELEDISAALSTSAQAAAAHDPHARFSIARPPWLEAEATRRALRIAEATGCPLYVVHVTCEAALHEILAARASGQVVFAETCPQYLGLTSDDERALGGLAKVAPPLRTDHDRTALLRAVLNGDIDVVSSDHAPYERSVKDDPAVPFDEIPVGMPGTETLLPVVWKLLSEAGADISLLHRVLTGNPSTIFGLTSKGHIDIGYDADLTIVDLGAQTTVRGDALHSRAGYSAFDGWECPLVVAASYQRGRPVLADGSLQPVTAGGFLSRARRKGSR